MAVTRWEFSSKGFRAVLNSPGVEADIASRAHAIANAAGEGFEARVFKGGYGGGRPIGVVAATTAGARNAEAEDKVLSSSIDAGR
jgi:hypothetical protein